MNGEILLLFVILLLGLILCTYLGGSSYVEGMTSFNSDSNTKYTASNGATATVTKNSDGTNTLVVTNKNEPDTIFTSSVINSDTYSGPNGGTATITNGSNGKSSLSVTHPDGSTKTVFQCDSSDSSEKNSNPVTNSLLKSASNSTTSFDNYNHFTGDSHATVYYGPDGGTVKVIDSGNGGTLVITSKNDNTEVYYINQNNQNNQNIPDVRAYYGPNGGSAKIISDNDGKSAVEVTKPDGTQIVYTEENTYASSDTTPYATNNVETNSFYGLAGGSATTATGPMGNTARSFTGPNGNTARSFTGPNGNTATSYNGNNGFRSGNNDLGSGNNGFGSGNNDLGSGNNGFGSGNNDLGSGNNGFGSGIASGIRSVFGSESDSTRQQSSDYYNSLPPGVPRNQIPNGQEDLYILKSQVVPPVCPACPPPVVKCDKNSDNSKCPPCPPCSRCPEPAFDCKKVPNYGSFNQNYMPIPVLNSFSTFGM